MPGAGRRVGLGALALWALVVAGAYQRHHPAAWGTWMQLAARTGWADLWPEGRALALAVARLAGTGAITASAAAIGVRLVTVLWPSGPEGEEATTPGERLWLAVVCGFAVQALAVTGLAAAGLLYVSLLYALLALTFALGARPLLSVVRAAVRRRPGSEPHTAASAAALVGVVVIAAAAVPVALSPQVLHDSLVYHLALPRVYLDAHGFVRLPNLVFANTPLNAEMLYVLAMALGGPPTAKLLHMVCGVGMLALTVSLGRRLFSRTAGLLAAFATLATPLVLGQLPTSYVDLAAAFAFLGAVWCVVEWVRTGQVGPVRVGAVALGLFAGMRYTSVYGVAAIAVTVGVVLLRRRAGVRGAAPVLLPFALGLAAGAGPWFLKNAIHVGNPVFPAAAGLFGAGPLSPTELARMQLLVQQHGMGHTARDLLLLPWRVTVYGNSGYGTFDGALSPLWLIAAPAAVAWRRMPGGFRVLALITGVYAVTWAFSTHVARYLIPVFPVCSVLAVGGLLRLVAPPHVGGRSGRGWVLAAFVAAGFWWVPAVAPTLVGALRFAPAAWGGESRDAFLLRTDPTARMFAYMDRELPPDAKVIGLWENRMLRCPRPLAGDAVYEAPHWLDRFGAADDPAAFARTLRAQGYTHVLLNTRHLERYPPRPTSEADAAAIQRALARLKAFTQEQCDERFAVDGLRLYAIRPGAGPAAAAP